MKKSNRSYLITDRADFDQKLKECISFGQNLLAQQILSDEALLMHKEEISMWSNKNSELLKQSFNNSENDYKLEYEKSYPAFNHYLGTKTLTDKVVQQKNKISCYIKGLEKILNKIDLIPIKKENTFNA